MIITSRHDVRMPESDDRLYRKPLGSLGRTELGKKCRRLKVFGPNSDVQAELQGKRKSSDDGNPRLLE